MTIGGIVIVIAAIVLTVDEHPIIGALLLLVLFFR